MKLSTNFVKDYVDIDVDVKKLAEDMTRVGNEYDSAGKLINATKLVIGEIIECVDHPDSDHLHLCKVNIGKEVLDIVCGAPNVRKGLKVIVALPGAKLPGGEIKKGMIIKVIYFENNADSFSFILRFWLRNFVKLHIFVFQTSVFRIYEEKLYRRKL